MESGDRDICLSCLCLTSKSPIAIGSKTVSNKLVLSLNPLPSFEITSHRIGIEDKAARLERVSVNSNNTMQEGPQGSASQSTRTGSRHTALITRSMALLQTRAPPQGESKCPSATGNKRKRITHMHVTLAPHRLHTE